MTGVDLVASPRYVGDEFRQGDALGLSVEFLRGFDFVWASPPCQPHSSMRVLHNARRHVDLVGPTRQLLVASGVPFVIENVPGAPLVNPITLCGSMFGLRTPCGAELRRHRLFEASFPVKAPACRHSGGPVIGIYGAHARNRRRPTGADHVPKTDFSAAAVDWAVTNDELSQMIPPSFSEFIARQFLAGLLAAAAE